MKLDRDFEPGWLRVEGGLAAAVDYGEQYEEFDVRSGRRGRGFGRAEFQSPRGVESCDPTMSVLPRRARPGGDRGARWQW